ncbi:MAG: RecX family transcriptional regulator [Pseudomonadota bacterium]
MALAYVARFAASAAKLDSYLKRKLRERGWAGEGDPGISALVARFVQAGYIDDAAFARAKAGTMRRRGLGERRVDQALGAAGIAPELREDVRAGEGAQRRAAVRFAVRRRIGPFGPVEFARLDHAAREKQLAALLRAGHRLDHARAVAEATDSLAAESWAAEADADDAAEDY